jgi:hypothetical protein
LSIPGISLVLHIFSLINYALGLTDGKNNINMKVSKYTFSLLGGISGFLGSGAAGAALGAKLGCTLLYGLPRYVKASLLKFNVDCLMSMGYVMFIIVWLILKDIVKYGISREDFLILLADISPVVC